MSCTSTTKSMQEFLKSKGLRSESHKKSKIKVKVLQRVKAERCRDTLVPH